MEAAGQDELAPPCSILRHYPVAGIFLAPAFARGRALLANKCPLVGDMSLNGINLILFLDSCLFCRTFYYFWIHGMLNTACLTWCLSGVESGVQPHGSFYG